MEKKRVSLLKKSWPVLVMLPILATMIYFLPDLVKVRQIQTRVVSQINSTCGCDLQMDSMRWHWTPLPHLTLKKVQINHSLFTAEIPRIDLSPQWSSLFRHRAEIGLIELNSPKITMLKIPDNSNPGKTVALAAIIVIKNGRLNMNSLSFPAIKSGSLNCRAINGEIVTTADSVGLELEFIPDFAGKITLAGKFDFQDFTYNFSVDSNEFQLADLVDGQDDIFLPLDSTINFSVLARGKGYEDFDLSINGELPDLAIRLLEKPARFDLAGGTLRFTKKGRDMSIGLLDVQANEPELTLNGSIERYFPKNSDLPFWHLDLSADEVDLTMVGKKIMTVFADNHIARTVCNIVREAQVNEAHYVFNGPLSDFNYLDKMLIEVDIETSTIYIPAPDLLLTKASGPIVIKKGKLTGDDLTAWLNNSHGTNGSVVVGISDGLNDFQLDLDIDADISELPDALHHLLDFPEFRAEIKKFHGEGRADGHLSMGDTLDDFTVKVAVTDMSRATVDYDRLPWRISPAGGRLDISNQTAYWTDFSAMVGPHHIKFSNGSASWKGEAELAVTALDALIEPESLFAELLSYPVPAEEIRKAISTITSLPVPENKIQLSSGELRGPFFSPMTWQYNFSALINNVKFTSPLLPDEVLIKKGRVSISQDSGIIDDCDAVFLDMPLNLNGRLHHKYWMDWFGSLTFNAAVAQRQWDWLLEKDLVSRVVMPKIPFCLEDFTVAWEPGISTINGAITGRTADSLQARADIFIQRKNDELFQLNCRISEENKNGEVKISHLPSPEGYSISWMGEGDIATLNKLFATPFGSGSINGTFGVKLKGYQPVYFRGMGRIENFSLPWGARQDVLKLKRLLVHGSGSNILLDDLDLNFRDETLRGSGKITAMPGSLHLNLDFSSSLFSWSTIEALQTVFQEETANDFPFTLTGRLNFDFAGFAYESIRKNKPLPAQFVWTPFQGNVTLHDSGKKSLNITSSQLCGLDMAGVLEWNNGQGRRRLNIKTIKNHHDRFEELLPCLHVINNSLEGRFELNCTLKGTEKEWTDGEFYLKSQKGNLRRMVLLSNIFRVINFTDLLVDYGESGFPYSLMDIRGHIKSDNIILDKAQINGRGLDMLGEGKINISNMDSNLTVYIIPLKTIDSVLNMVPVVGRAVGGRKGHIVTIPVSISGNIKDPDLNVMSIKAVGLSTLKWIGDTFLLPYDLLIKPFTDDKETSPSMDTENSHVVPGNN